MLCEENKEQAENPQWEDFDKQWKHVHDWRTYVTTEIRVAWFDIDVATRCLIISIAQEAADHEHWD